MPAPWILPAGRAVLCIALGLVVAFTGGHSAGFGLIAFGAFAVASGLFLGIAALLVRGPRGSRSRLAVPAVLSLIAGVAALAVPTGGIGYLVLMLSGWALLTGAAELVAGIRSRRDVDGRARDAMIVGALTVVLGVVVLVLPPDLSIDYSGEKQVSGILTSSIIVVGALGAWAVVVGVLEGIAAASPSVLRARTAS